MVYTQQRKLINKVTYTYQGEDDQRCFPEFYNLPPNYQTPKSIETTVCNDQKEQRVYKTEAVLNDYGNPASIKAYNSTISDSFSLSKHIIYTYDDKHYSLLLNKTTYDYTSHSTDPIITMVANTLTSDLKNIGTTQKGFVHQGNFEPTKQITYDYVTTECPYAVGKIQFEKVEWVDNQEHHPMSTQVSITYNYEPSTGQFMKTMTDAQGNQTTFVTDACTGLVLSKNHPLGYTVSYGYDSLGRKLHETRPSVNPSTVVTTLWKYDDIHNQVSTFYPNGYVRYTNYDGFGDQIQISDNLGVSPSDKRVLLTRAYNNQGQLYQTQGILGKNTSFTFQYTDRNLLESITDALGNCKKYTYDVVQQTQQEQFNGQLVKQKQFNDQHATLEEQSVDFAQGLVKSFTADYNAFGNPTSWILGSKESGQSWMESSFQYDPDEQICAMHLVGSDGIVADRLITRDLFGNSVANLITTNQPCSSQKSTSSDEFSYNDLNQLIKEQNPLGQSYQYTR